MAIIESLPLRQQYSTNNHWIASACDCGFFVAASSYSASFATAIPLCSRVGWQYRVEAARRLACANGRGVSKRNLGKFQGVFAEFLFWAAAQVKPRTHQRYRVSGKRLGAYFATSGSESSAPRESRLSLWSVPVNGVVLVLLLGVSLSSSNGIQSASISQAFSTVLKSHSCGRQFF